MSNESNLSVFFDNLSVTHTPGSILEENAYYPFGLSMAGISSKAIGKLDNRYKFNGGTELENKEFSDGSGLELYATDFRSYDPQIARFLQIDALGEIYDSWSPYTFANDNPILINDPLGLANDTTTLEEVVVVGYRPGPESSKPDPSKATQFHPLHPAIGLKQEWSPENENLPSQEDRDVSIKLLGYDRYDLIEVLRHTVENKPTGWQRFWKGVFFEGKNIFGEDVYRRHFGGTPPDGAIGRVGGNFTTFTNISKRIRAASTIKFFVGIRLVKFEAALAKAAGKAWEVSRDGKVKILFYKGLKYVSRAFSSSGEKTVEIWKDGELLQKYRLLD